MNYVLAESAVRCDRAGRGAFHSSRVRDDRESHAVPPSMLGGIGWFQVPVDIISVPATNVCIGIAIDSMIHLALAFAAHSATERKGGTPGYSRAKNNGAASFIPR